MKGPKSAEIELLPANIIRVKFKKSWFNYKPGQYVFLCVPSLSIFEWHPFSISSTPHQAYVTLHIRELGNWTKRLQQLAAESGPNTRHSVLIEGAYGEPQVDIDTPSYKCFLLLSGGIGVTPMQSVCNYLIQQHQEGRPLVKVWFIWACRDKFMVDSMFNAQEVVGTAKAHTGDGARDDAEVKMEEEGEAMLKDRLPRSFQPDTLSRVANSIRGTSDPATEVGAEGTELMTDDFLHTEFYLTQARSVQDYEGANIRPELQACLRMGRPDLPFVFDHMKALAVANGEGRVAVLSCGPTQMVDEARKLAWVKSDLGVKFDFHTETFAF